MEPDNAKSTQAKGRPPIGHLNVLNAELRDLAQLPELSPQSAQAIAPHLQSINAHSNALTRIHPTILAPFTSLLTLNLSSNSIRCIEGLSSLVNLTTLNLSSNLISTVEGLSSLVSLTRLSLSYNEITSLAGLRSDRFQSSGSRLRVLELHDNRIADLGQLSMLAGCQALKEITLQLDPEHSNPVCRGSKHFGELMRLLPGLTRVDSQNLDPSLLLRQPEAPSDPDTSLESGLKCRKGYYSVVSVSSRLV
jgi:hypothetical protein